MPTFEKPTITKFNQRCNTVLELLKVRVFVTKKEIADVLGWEYPKMDRQIRQIVEAISHSHPIISTSDTNKGYKLAQGVDDAEWVKHSWAEIDSRINELTKRKRPLIKFMDKHNIKITLFN